MNALTSKLVVAAVLVVASSASQSAVVDLNFSEQATGNCAFIGQTATSQGVVFKKIGTTTGFFACNTPGLIASNPTSKAMIDANARSNFTMELVNGGDFDLLSFNAGARTNNNTTGIRLTGNLLAGGQVSTDLMFTGTTWGLFKPTGFTGLTSVTWLGLGNSGQFVFDNVSLNNDPVSVSLPGTLALMGLGLMGLVSRRRKAS